MSKKGLVEAASAFSSMQTSREKLFRMGTEGKIDHQDILLAQMLEDGKNAMKDRYEKLSLMKGKKL